MLWIVLHIHLIIRELLMMRLLHFYMLLELDGLLTLVSVSCSKILHLIVRRISRQRHAQELRLDMRIKLIHVLFRILKTLTLTNSILHLQLLAFRTKNLGIKWDHRQWIC